MSKIHVVHDNNASKGVGFTGLLQLVFIVLKLCNVINWSWWLVLLPTLITCGIAVILFALLLWAYKK